MLNLQIPVKQERKPNLLVHSIFNTIQGEGPFIGHRSVFVRLAGCNLQCPGCDTEYTQGAVRMDTLEVAYKIYTVIDKNEHLDPRYLLDTLVVITGGEPFRQDIAPLIKHLLLAKARVQIETNGTLFNDDLPYGHKNLTIVCSPKAGKVNKWLEPYIDAYKYVVKAGEVAEDGLPTSALGLPARPARPKNGAPVYINPLDEKDVMLNNENMRAAAISAMQHGYILGVQLHKLYDLE